MDIKERFPKKILIIRELLHIMGIKKFPNEKEKEKWVLIIWRYRNYCSKEQIVR